MHGRSIDIQRNAGAWVTGATTSPPRSRVGDMPYGVVMATGGASAAAGFCGMPVTGLSLTGLAMVQALWIAGWMARDRVSVQRWRFGLFTVPLGLAVIAQQLQALAPTAGDVILTLSWSTAVVLGCWGVACRFIARASFAKADGTWFLAPAALLGAAAATAVGAHSQWPIRVAVVACLAGAAGYGAVILACVPRLPACGADGSPKAPWWIAAGCGGLAADALGRVAGMVATGNMQHLLDGLVVVVWAAGTVLLAAVLLGTAFHVWHRARGPWACVWTPVFSTAVYAAGTAVFASLTRSHAMQVFATAAAGATLVLWAVNSGLWLWRRGWRVPRLC